MKTHPDGTREFVIGTTGSGKTFYTVHRSKAVPRLIAIDPKRTLKKTLPHDTVIDGDLGALLQYLKGNFKGNFRVIYHPEPGNEVEETHHICRLVEIMQGPYRDEERGARKVMLILEEAAQSVPNPTPRKVNGALRMATMGREMGVDLLCVTQRPQDVSKVLREMFDGRVTCFGVVGDDAIDAASKLMASAADAAEKIAKLGQYEHVIYLDGVASTRGPLKE